MALTDGLIHYWSMEGDGTDEVGSVDGTAIGLSTGTGIISSCLDFGGSVSHLSFPAYSYDGGDVVSISTWFKYQTGGDSNPSIFNCVGDAYHRIYLSGTTIVVLMSTTTARPNTCNTAITVTPGSWYHVVSVLDIAGGYLRVFVNGVYVAETAITGGLTTDTTSYTSKFGEWATNTNATFKGSIDESGFWNRVLTYGGVSVSETAGGEVAQLYNGGSGLAYPLETNETSNNTAMHGNNF